MIFEKKCTVASYITLKKLLKFDLEMQQNATQYPLLLFPSGRETSNTHGCESVCCTGQRRRHTVHWILWVFSIKYCHSSRKIVKLQTEFKMKGYIIMPIHQCDYRGGWKINCLFNNIPAHVFSMYAVSLYTIYTGCSKILLSTCWNKQQLLFLPKFSFYLQSSQWDAYTRSCFSQNLHR